MHFNQPQAAATRELLPSSPVERLHDALGRLELLELHPRVRIALARQSGVCGEALKAAHANEAAAEEADSATQRALLLHFAALDRATAERTALAALDALEAFEVRR